MMSIQTENSAHRDSTRRKSVIMIAKLAFGLAIVGWLIVTGKLNLESYQSLLRPGAVLAVLGIGIAQFAGMSMIFQRDSVTKYAKNHYQYKRCAASRRECAIAVLKEYRARQASAVSDNDKGMQVAEPMTPKSTAAVEKEVTPEPEQAAAVEQKPVQEPVSDAAEKEPVAAANTTTPVVDGDSDEEEVSEVLSTDHNSYDNDAPFSDDESSDEDVSESDDDDDDDSDSD